MRNLLLAFISAFFCSLGMSQGVQPEQASQLQQFQKFKNSIATSMFICQLTGKNAILNLDTGRPVDVNKIRACIEDGKRDSRAEFEQIRDRLEGKKSVQDAFKDYYSACLTVFDGLFPNFRAERQGSYDLRVESEYRRLKQMSNRIELDL